MTLGAGKYDVFATLVQEATQADGVVVVVFGGAEGSSFAVQIVATDVQQGISYATGMAQELRKAAASIEADAAALRRRKSDA